MRCVILVALAVRGWFVGTSDHAGMSMPVGQRWQNCVANQFGGQTGIRPTEAIFCLRMICERATLLAKPLYITKIDIVKAFGRILIAAVNRAYKARGVSDATRTALIREMIDEYRTQN